MSDESKQSIESNSVEDAHQQKISHIATELSELPVIENDLYRDILHLIKKHRDSRSHTDHQMVRVLNVWTGVYCIIDKNISELIYNIWLTKIGTIMSCEANVPKNYIWIQFASEKDLHRFLEVVFIGTDVDTQAANRALGSSEDYDDTWDYSMSYDLVTLSDINGTPEIDKKTDPGVGVVSTDTPDVIGKITSAHSIRFPSQDYDFILKRFKQHNNFVLDNK